MRSQRRIRAAVAITGLVIASLTACGGSDDSGGGNSDPGPVTIWLPPVGGDEQLREQLARFTDETGIDVKVEDQGWDTYFQTLTTALTTGEGPDVAAIGNTWTASFAPIGGLVEFDDARFDELGGKDRFLAAPLTSTGPEGETPVAVPWLAQSYGLLYSKSALEKAGVSAPPATWDEFIDVGKELTGDGTFGTSAVGASNSGPNTTLLWAIIRQYGGELFDADGKPTFSDPAVVDAVQEYLRWFTEGVANPASAEYTGDGEAIQDLADGTSAMVVLQNGSVAGAIAAGMDPEDLGVALTPALDPIAPRGADVRSHVAGINLAMFESSNNQDNAMKLIEFLLQPDTQLAAYEATSSLPVVEDAYDNEVFSSPENEVFGETIADLSEPLPMVPQQGQMQTILGTVVTALVAQAASTGDVSESDIESALDDANEQVAALG